METNISHKPNEIIYDRAGKGIKEIGETKISTPDYRLLKRDTEYQKRVKNKKFRRRGANEPVVGHLKTDFRMTQNYLSGNYSNQINAFLAATGWNLKKMMKQLKEKNKTLFEYILNLIFKVFYANQKLSC